MARRGVHGARAALQRHVLAQDHRHFALVERVAQLQAFERGTLHARHFARAGIPARFSTDAASSVASRSNSAPAEVSMASSEYSNSGAARPPGSRQRPRRRGQITTLARPAGNATPPHRRARSTRSATSKRTSIDGDVRSSYSTPPQPAPSGNRGTSAPACSLVEVPVADDLCEGAQLLRLVARLHREVRLVPVAHHAQTDEVAPLHVHLAAAYSRHLWRNALASSSLVSLRRLLDLQFDRQAVTVPAGTYGASWPSSVRDLTMMSFRTLFTEWPMWIARSRTAGVVQDERRRPLATSRSLRRCRAPPTRRASRARGVRGPLSLGKRSRGG